MSTFFQHGLEGRVVEPLVQRLFRKPPHLADLDRWNLAAAGLAIDGVGHDAEGSCDLVDIHDSRHGGHPLYRSETGPCPPRTCGKFRGKYLQNYRGVAIVCQLFLGSRGLLWSRGE